MGTRTAILLIGLTVGLLVHAEPLQYRIVSPLMGTLGTITIDKNVGRHRYRINVEVRSRGIAALLTGKRREHYRSEGDVEQGRLESRHLRLERRSNRKRETIDYRFDLSHHKISKNRLRWKKGRLDANRSETLPYFTREDLLTLYFNNIGTFLHAAGKKHWEIPAVGAEKIRGRILVDRLEGTDAEHARTDLDVKRGTPILVFYSPQKIAGKRNRRFTVAVDEEGQPLRIRFVAIPVVGEIFVERL